MKIYKMYYLGQAMEHNCNPESFTNTIIQLGKHRNLNTNITKVIKMLYSLEPNEEYAIDGFTFFCYEKEDYSSF